MFSNKAKVFWPYLFIKAYINNNI